MRNEAWRRKSRRIPSGKTVILKVLVLCLCLALLPASASAEAGECSSRLHAPYWHRDADCIFGEFWRGNERGDPWYPEETRIIPVSQAEAEGQKPCPGCAATFAPMFTGEFPQWTSALAPWGIHRGEMDDSDGWPRGGAELPRETLASWGMPVEKLRALYPEGEDPETGSIVTTYPDDYAGVFVNACGGYTILLVDPTEARVQEWRAMLEGEFWVISARYSMNELNALQRWVENQILEPDAERMRAGEPSWYHIVSVGVDEVGNAVEIGVTPDGFDEGVSRIREALSGAGYDDARMISFIPENYPAWEDF